MKRNLSYAVLIAMLLIFSDAHSQWEHVNFADGGNAGIVKADSAGFIYVRTAYSGQIYRSSDNGNTWQNCTHNLPFTTDMGANDMYVRSNSVFLAMKSYGMYKSTNHGETWFQANNGLGSIDVQCLAGNSMYIFTITSNGIYRSEDDGITWEYSNSGIGFSHGGYAIAVKNSTIFAAIHIGATGYMYRSTNNGTNWVLCNTGLPSFSIDNLSICGDCVYASNIANGLYETTNYGEQWHPIVTSSIKTLYSIGDTAFASKMSSITTNYVTTNAGLYWSANLYNFPQAYFNGFLILPQCMFGTTYNGGIYKSSNMGFNWTESMNGLQDIEIKTVTARNNIVLTTTSGIGNYRSTDYGLSWSRNYTNYTFKKYVWVGNELYTCNLSGVLQSTDFGLTFVQKGNQINLIRSFLILNHNSFMVFDGNYLYRSTNGGVNWIQSTNGIPSFTFLSGELFNKDSVCFIGFENMFSHRTLYRSMNFGLNWDTIPHTDSIAFPNIISYNPNDSKYYLGCDYGVFTSTNTGTNWSPSNNGLPVSREVTSFFFNGDTIYASLQRGGIYRAAKQSSIWTPYNDGLANTEVNSVTGSNNYLYAGVTNGGFFRRPANIFTSVSNDPVINYDYEISQNYPNPFNPVTKIQFALPENSEITLKVYNILGQLVKTLVNRQLLDAGRHQVDFDGSNLASGVYFYRLESDKFSDTKRMVLIK